MKLSVRWQLFLAFLALVLVTVATSGLVLSGFLRDNLIAREAGELSRQADISRIFLNAVLVESDISSVDQLADRLGRATGARATIVLSDGTVVGDSELTLAEIRKIENHRSRPEIREAMSSGKGLSRRHSITVGHEMIYVARAFDSGHQKGVVRISTALEDVDQAVAALYGLLISAGVIGLILATIMGVVTSHLFSKTLQQLVQFARHASEGRREPLVISEDGELGGIASSVKKLAGEPGRNLEALARERDQFEAVLEGMSDAVLSLDANRRVTLINRAALMLLNLGEQPIGRTLLETVRVAEFNLLLNHLQPGEEVSSEFDLGLQHPRRVLARAVRRQAGDYVVVLQDVTDLRRLENLRRDFVSNVSHELRTPISIVRANAETLMDGALFDPEVAHRFLASILDNAARLSSLISDLLDISRIEEGKYAVEKEALPVHLSLRRTAAALETRAMEKRFSLRVEPCPDLLVKADVRALDQILFNLLDNAVKYANPGGKVTLRAMKQGPDILIEVEDDGPGVDPLHRERLFERFYRVDKGRSREMGGTGLGLAIVKHLAVAMGGSVGMRPAEEKGSVFWVRLPSLESSVEQ